VKSTAGASKATRRSVASLDQGHEHLGVSGIALVAPSLKRLALLDPCDLSTISAIRSHNRRNGDGIVQPLLHRRLEQRFADRSSSSLFSVL
jgi:hypothetical protein